MADNQLTPVQDSISQLLRAGKSPDFIRQQLQSADWPDTEIEKNLAPFGLDKATQESGDPGFWSTLYKGNVQPIVDAVKSGVSSGLPGPLGVMEQLGRMGLGGIGAQTDQAKQAWQSLMGQGDASGMGIPGRASEAVGHGLASILPLVGPAAAETGEQFGAAHPAAGAADALGLLGQVYGPKLMEKLGLPIRASGEQTYQDAFNFPKDQASPSV